MHRKVILPVLIFLAIFCTSASGKSGTGKSQPVSQKEPIHFFDNMSGNMQHEAAQVTSELKKRARSLLEHTPLGWNLDTLDYAFHQLVLLPSKLPQLISHILEQSRILGFVGSVIMFIFLLAIVYSLVWRRRALTKAERLAKPLIDKMPEEIRPYIFLILVSITAALIPLLLLAIFVLVRELISYNAPWFLLIGKLFVLWSIGALLISLVKGIVDRGILEIQTKYGTATIRLIRVNVFYILISIAVIWSAEAFGLRQDFLALLKFILYLSIVIVLFLFFLRKKLVLSLLPQLPFPAYQRFLRGLNRYYQPVIILTFLSGIIWCIGFHYFCAVLWKKTWAIAGVYIGFSLVYHLLIQRLQKWADSIDASDEKTHLFIRSLKNLSLYVTIVITVLVMMDLLGVMEPLRRIMSFPILRIGSSSLTLWILCKAVLIIIAFLYSSQFLCSYLNYKVYPSMGVEPGLAYAIDTFLKYFLLIVGVFVSLQIVGFDLRALLVFAGAIGIGIGLAMQNIASNLLSGFAIILGGKIRKGDWLEVSGTLGEVTDIYLRATKIRTRDNIEYLVPNSDLTSKTIVNYSLTSPLIRIRIPFGVSYSSDPHEVARIVTETAEKDTALSHIKKPDIRFTGYGDNSINFELLVWMDIRRNAKDLVKSRLYFAMFDALKQAGIEIPFPQRDLHIRSGVPWEKMINPEPDSAG